MPQPEMAAPPARPAACWMMPSACPDQTRTLQDTLNLHPLPAAILVARGLHDPAEAQRFLEPELENLHDPFLLAGMAEAAGRLSDAIRKREPILLYGDYDVDGTCSIVVLKKAIELLGGLAEFHIPDRLKDGYGMKSEVIGRAADSGVRLVVSVDTGIRANEVVRHANGLGIDVIVTDHHLPETELPPALAVLNPHREDCCYPNKNLCGAGVTLKLVQALLAQSGLPQARQTALLHSFLKPVAIATVADIVPLTGENRIIVKRGLSGLQQVRNPGLRALLSVAGFDPGECPTAHQVAFRLAPRINAAGRMATAKDVVELFLTDDNGRAQTLSEQLNRLNGERQQVEADIVEAVLQQCEGTQTPEECAALVFAGSGWHLGVLGIVASRLVERFSRPVFVLSESLEQDDDGQPYFSGSGRSIPAFHLLEALESMPELFKKFGGHRQAAGLSLRAKDVGDFRKRFDRFAAGKLSPEDFRPCHTVDAHVTLRELTDSCAAEVLSLGPFGFGNPAPLLHCSKVQVVGNPRPLGSDKHVSISLRQGSTTLSCKAWNFGDDVARLQPDSTLDVLLQIEDDPYGRKRGYRSWCLSMKDFRVC